jgi:predicted alpha-1,2-mannosidase
MINRKLRMSALALIFHVSCVSPALAQNNLSYVDPQIGAVGHLLQPTRATVQLPNQLIRMFPVRKDYMEDQIESFPLNIVSHRLGQVFSLRPYVKSISADSWTQRFTFDHDLEVTRPWFFSTYLVDEEVNVEFVPGQKVGIYRFAFPEKATAAGLLLDVYNKGASQWNLAGGKELTGLETYHDDIKVYLYGMLNTTATLSPVNGQPQRASLAFAANRPDTIELRYAISYISAEQAKKNYNNEFSKGAGFRQLKTQGELAWSKVINQVQVKGGTEAQRRSFYSALYRCYERMVNITEDGKYYSGFDKQVHESKRPFYVDDWTWDTYLAHHPLRMILNPAQEEDMLDSYVDMYNQSGWMPTFPVLFGDHACMNGFHSSIVFLDAYRKGLRHFDVPKAFEGMKKNATEATMLPWRNGPKGELDDVYLTKGFFPGLKVGDTERVAQVYVNERRQSVAVTLGHSYDDWALGQLAKELGKQDDYQTFNTRGQNYRKLWNDKARFFMPKDANGNWIDIDPKFDGGKGGRDYYDENNGWTYLWQVQQDVKGLMGLMGGRTAFESRLDQLFREPLGRSKQDFLQKFPDATGNVGQYSMGNEPSFHIPYLFNYTKSPWKTQKHIRFLLDVWFKDNIFGIPGDEDGGGMSAFVVFSSMGFYPVTPGVPVYTIGSPLFEKTSIALANGKKFTVVAHGASKVNKYIQQAKFDGKPLDTPWFTHEQLMAGGTLELEMGSRPNKNWGVTENNELGF